LNALPDFFISGGASRISARRLLPFQVASDIMVYPLVHPD
jgi:hypothetical protein